MTKKEEPLVYLGRCDRPSPCGAGWNNRVCFAYAAVNIKTGAKVKIKCSAFKSAHRARQYAVDLYNKIINQGD